MPHLTTRRTCESLPQISVAYVKRNGIFGPRPQAFGFDCESEGIRERIWIHPARMLRDRGIERGRFAKQSQSNNSAADAGLTGLENWQQSTEMTGK